MNERNKDKKVKVERGRDGVDLTPAMQTTETGLVADSRDDAAHSSGRPPRVSMGNMQNLSVPDNLREDGYFYYWFQDKDGRVARAKAAYYEHVVDEQGTNYTRSAGPYSMVLMRLRQDYRDEDLQLKNDRVQATLEEEAGIGANEYAPDQRTGRAEGGTSAVTRSLS